MEDRQIVELYWQREESALTESRHAYGQTLRRIAYGILRSREDAEETENDTYLKAWNAIPPQRPEHLRGFLAKICRRLALDRLDWRTAEKRNGVLVELTAEMAECIPDALAEQSFELAELGGLLSVFLAAQPERQRRLFLHRYFLAEPLKEAARAAGMSESGANSALSRLRGRLKTYLEQEGLEL